MLKTKIRGTCPYCYRHAVAASDPYSDQVPYHGDLARCGGCGAFCVIDFGQRRNVLRKPTAREAGEIALNPHALRLGKPAMNAHEATIRAALALSPQELGDKIRASEVALGFSVIAQARWLDPEEWTARCIISQDNRRIRLVALEARHPHTGAFGRLVEKIMKEDHVPVVVEPNALLTEWCRRHWYRKRFCGQGELRHVIWYPKRCGY